MSDVLEELLGDRYKDQFYRISKSLPEWLREFTRYYFYHLTMFYVCVHTNKYHTVYLQELQEDWALDIRATETIK